MDRYSIAKENISMLECIDIFLRPYLNCHLKQWDLIVFFVDLGIRHGSNVVCSIISMSCLYTVCQRVKSSLQTLNVPFTPPSPSYLRLKLNPALPHQLPAQLAWLSSHANHFPSFVVDNKTKHNTEKGLIMWIASGMQLTTTSNSPPSTLVLFHTGTDEEEW